MSTRFSNTNDHYYATTGVPGTAFTYTLWFYVVASTGTWQRLIDTPASIVDDNQFYQYLGLDTTASNVIFPAYGNAALNPAAVTTGVWYRAAVASTGSSVTVYAGQVGSALSTDTGAIALNAPLSVFAGGRGTELFNGRIAAFKMWNGVALTQAEIITELAQYVPSRTAGLTRFHPLQVAELTDYSGSGNTLTASATAATTEANPPLPWDSPCPVVTQYSSLF